MARSLHLGAALCACMLLGSSTESASAKLAPGFLGAMDERPARTASGVRGSGSSVLPELAARPKAGAKMDLVVEEGNDIRRVDDMQRDEAGEAEELEGRRLEEGELVRGPQLRASTSQRTNHLNRAAVRTTPR